MQLLFTSISEPTRPGEKWQKLFQNYWPAYETWLISKDVAEKPDLTTAKAMLKKYMPEMVSTYDRLCSWAVASPRAAHFLTGWCPPAYINACSQAVSSEKDIQLVRNYDFHPNLFEGTLLLSKWNSKKVISNSDSLIGTLDGINEDGLAISLTYGGRTVIGEGFGIPFILRYVLEFCSTVGDAVKALRRIPSHMAYNITVVDRTGKYKTVIMAPDRKTLVTNSAYSTNHQHTKNWPQNGVFNKTVERTEYLRLLLAKKDMNAEKLADAFLHPPLYNSLFKEGFGTLYTSVYNPKGGKVKFRWPETSMEQSFASFTEESRYIEFVQAGAPVYQTWVQRSAEIARIIKSPSGTYPQGIRTWQHELADVLVEKLAASMPKVRKSLFEILRNNMIENGDIRWDLLATFWADRDYMNWEKWILKSRITTH